MFLDFLFLTFLLPVTIFVNFILMPIDIFFGEWSTRFLFQALYSLPENIQKILLSVFSVFLWIMIFIGIRKILRKYINSKKIKNP